MEGRIVYFDEPGKQNTDTVLNIVNDYVKTSGIRMVLVASTTGETAVKAVNVLKEVKIIALGHSTGLRKPNVQELTEDNRKIIESKGGVVFVGTHLFSGLSGAMSKRFSTHIIGDVIASTLRIFGNGMKVICEVTCEAADAGFVRTDEDIVVISGSHAGADMAAVVRPANSQDFFDLKIREILCKPHM